MLKGTAVQIDDKVDDESDDLKNRVLARYQQIFIPIGVPVIAGPGAITTVIIYGYQGQTMITHVVMSLTMVAVLAVLFFTLLLGPCIQNRTGELPLNLISRVFGMILIAIAVQFMVEGLTDVFPGWAG